MYVDLPAMLCIALQAGTSKNEDTWYAVLGYFDIEQDSTPRVFEGWWHGRHGIHFARNHDGNLNVPYLIENDGKVVLNWNWLDNDFNSNNPALRRATLFISLPQISRESFVLKAADQATHQTSCQSHTFFPKVKHIACHRGNWFPK